MIIMVSVPEIYQLIGCIKLYSSCDLKVRYSECLALVHAVHAHKWTIKRLLLYLMAGLLINSRL